MESKLNHTAIESYSAAYSKKLASGFFEMEDTINGRQILNLSNIQQVNLLVIKNLFQKWKKETNKLQSPYFNYDAEEVKAALQAFMNALSKNIDIKRNNFEPLLKKAVQDAILLIFSPYDFYSKEMNHPDRSRISLNDLKETSKYIKVNRKLLDAIISRFENDDIEEVFNDEAFSILSEISREIKNEPESYDHFLQKFSEVLPLSMDTIFFDLESDHESEDYELLKGRQSHIETSGNISETLEEKETGPKSINEKFFKSQKTLNEKLISKPGVTLADVHRKKKIDSIKQHITLNQKFMFINGLFEGDKDDFNHALDRLERCANYSEAMQLIRKDYINKYDWSVTNEEVKEFLSVVSKKYE